MRSARPVKTSFGYTLITGLAFSIYHIIVSPAAAYIDSTSLVIGRGPLFEELFKFSFAYFFLRSLKIKKQAIIIGLSIGLSETLINTFVVFHEMFADISSDTEGGNSYEVWAIIFAAMSIKAIYSTFAHGIIFYLGLKLAKENYVRGFFIAVALHFFANILLSAT